MIVDAVLRRGEKAVLPAKAENIPGIDQGPAFDRAVQQGDRFFQQPLGMRQTRPVTSRLAPRRSSRRTMHFLDRQVRRGQPAVDVALQPGRGHRHDPRLPLGRLRIAHPREELGQMHVLQLLRAAAGQVLVEMLPHAAERLPQRHGFRLQTLRMRPLHLRQQPLVEGVAVDGDLLHQRRQRHARIVGLRPVAADPRAHQDRARQHGGRFVQHLFIRQAAAMLDPFHHGVQRHLLQHKAAAPPRIVQLAQIPLAKEIVRPLVHRVVEVVGPGIDRQFLQQRKLEHRIELQRRIDGFEDRQGTRDQVVIAAHAHAHAADEKRDRPHPFVRVRLDFLLCAQHGHRPVAEVVVELGDRPADDAVGFFPWPALLQYGFTGPADEQRLKEGFFRLVEQQIGMELAVAGQRLLENQP